MNDVTVGLEVEPSLDALGVRFGADKSSLDHDYLVFYERFFERIRHNQLKILEIGVFEGASLKVWEAYFPNAQIVGADIDPAALRFGRDRVTIELVDQSNLQNLVDLGVRHGPFDIIIEDGSHIWEHQITTLRTLFPFVRNGGFYVVEDLQTNYGGLADSYRGRAETSCVEFLKALADRRIADDQHDLSTDTDPFLRTYGRAVGFLAFTRRACLIEKRLPGETRFEGRGAPLFSPGATRDALALPLRAHVGREGEQSNMNGWINRISARGNHNIQGFVIDIPTSMPAEPALELEYRARRQNGDWGDWMPSGRFAGTSGLGEDLTGFALRLTGACNARYIISAIGAFRDWRGQVEFSSGDCCAATNLGRLCGMQITLRQANPDIGGAGKPRARPRRQPRDASRKP